MIPPLAGRPIFLPEADCCGAAFEIAAGSRACKAVRRSKIVRVVRFVTKALDYLRELNILSLALRLLGCHAVGRRDWL